MPEMSVITAVPLQMILSIQDRITDSTTVPLTSTDPSPGIHYANWQSGGLLQEPASSSQAVVAERTTTAMRRRLRRKTGGMMEGEAPSAMPASPGVDLQEDDFIL